MAKIIALRYGSPHLKSGDPIVRDLVFVDEGKGERAIDKIKKAVEKKYEEQSFVKNHFALVEVTTLWSD